MAFFWTQQQLQERCSKGLFIYGTFLNLMFSRLSRIIVNMITSSSLLADLSWALESKKRKQNSHMRHSLVIICPNVILPNTMANLPLYFGELQQAAGVPCSEDAGPDPFIGVMLLWPSRPTSYNLFFKNNIPFFKSPSIFQNHVDLCCQILSLHVLAPPGSCSSLPMSIIIDVSNYNLTCPQDEQEKCCSLLL